MNYEGNGHVFWDGNNKPFRLAIWNKELWLWGGMLKRNG